METPSILGNQSDPDVQKIIDKMQNGGLVSGTEADLGVVPGDVVAPPPEPAPAPSGQEPPVPEPPTGPIVPGLQNLQDPPPEPGAAPVPPQPLNFTDEQKLAVVKEFYGDRFTSLDEVRGSATRLDQYESLASENQGHVQELTNLREQNANAQDPFFNESIRTFNYFVEDTGIEDYGVYSSLVAMDVDVMDDVDSIVANTLIETPALAGSKETVRKSVQQRFHLGEYAQKDEEGNVIPSDIDKVNLLTESTRAKTALKGYKAKLATAAAKKPNTVDFAAQREELKTGWSPVIDKMMPAMDKVPVYLKGQKTPITAYVLNDEEKGQVRELTEGIILGQMLPVNEANVMKAYNTVMETLYVAKRNEINHLLAEKIRSMKEDEYRKIYHNPSALGQQPTPEVGPPAGQAEEGTPEDAARQVKQYYQG